MDNAIKKSVGTNKSERHLTALCEKSFLSLWSYPNPYRDNPSGPNREICDLLVVCEDAVIIFSDKCCEFPDTGDPKLDWKRWYRRTVEAGGKQVFGAERMLRSFPNRVFTDTSCEHPLPPQLPSASRMRVHRIVVARGAKDRCRQAHGLSGSLILAPAELKTTDASPSFYVGDPFPDHGFVHVLDDVTLKLLLGELDTVTDFLDYLEEKEAFIRADRLYNCFGEENLLAWYLQRMNEDKSRHHIYCPAGKQLQLTPTQWAEFCESKDRLSRKDADRISYAWDVLIEDFSRHLFNGSLTTEEPRSPSEIEQGLRIMAKERRLGRRSLAGAMAGALHTESGSKAFVRSIFSSRSSQLAYVFAICPKNDMDDETYASMRRKYLSDYCFVLASKFRQLKTVVGIATQTLEWGENRNFDMVVQESPAWDKEQEDAATEIKNGWGFQSDDAITRWERTEYEYPNEMKTGTPMMTQNVAPQLGRPRMPRPGRNSTCPCGSGEKYKHCCLR